jgi:hypothetical protein
MEGFGADFSIGNSTKKEIQVILKELGLDQCTWSAVM